MCRMLGRASFLIRRDLTLGNVAERLARAHGDRPLVTEAGGGLTLTHRQAAKRVARWAGGVAARTDPGDVVVVAAPNGYEQLLLCLAVARAGCIPAPVSDAMGPDEVGRIAEDVGAAFVLRSAHEVDRHEPVREAVAAAAGDVAALFHAPGSTGSPGCVALTHDALLGPLRAGALVPTPLRHDEAVVSLPVAHSTGFVTLLRLAVTGTATWFAPRFHAAEVLDAIESRRAAAFVGVPDMYCRLLEAGAEARDLRSVRSWASGAEAVPADLALRFKRMGATARLPLVGDVGEAGFAHGPGMAAAGAGAGVPDLLRTSADVVQRRAIVALQR